MNIAVLIDAENVDPAYAGQIFSYAGSIGTVTVKEIYGAGIALNEWADPILKYAIHMNMTLKPNKFKNSSDIALVIGAMDLMLNRAAASPAPGGSPCAAGEGKPEEESGAGGPSSGVDTVIIASSDSDFSALSVRLRTAGIQVVGMGNTEKTNSAWPMACSTFISFTADTQPVRASEQQLHPKPQPQVHSNPKRPEKKEPPPHENEAAKVASTHSARVEVIRSFIAAQLEANGGKMHTTALLGMLNTLPDYRFDQVRSKRKPLDYLIRQYGNSFTIEKENDGFYWVSADKADKANQKDKGAAGEAEAPPEAPPGAQAAPPPPEEAAKEASKEPQRPAGETDPAAVFIAAGVPEEAAKQIAAICKESRHDLRSIYNRLRKVFGDNEGRKYYQLVKKHRI